MERILIIAFTVYFIHALFWPKHILSFIKYYLEKRLPEGLLKPIFGCPICMCPWWGTLIYLLGYKLGIEYFNDIRPQMIVLTVFAAGGVNTIMLQLNRIANFLYDNIKK